MQRSNLPSSIIAALELRCGGIVSQQAVWSAAAGKLLTTGATEAEALLLLEHLGSPRNVEALLKGLAQEGLKIGEFIENISEAADRSDYSLAEWMKAFERVQLAVGSSSKAVKPSAIMGYVQCTAEYGSARQCGESLLEVVGTMLDEFGFEGEEGCYTGARE